MTRLFRRRHVDPEVADAVRRSLARHADDAPDDPFFAERVINAAQTPARSPQRMRSRLVPALAAAAAVVAVGGVVVGVTHLGRGGSHDDAVRSAPSPSISRTAPGASATAPRPDGTAPATGSGTAMSPSTNNVVSLPSLHDVTLLDATFTGAGDGWALASADCLGSTGRCTALLRTTDGSTWTSHPNTPFNVPGVSGGCSSPCVSHLRFATDRIGYAYGASALFMTTDGGGSWHRQSGGALALATADGNVVRITSNGTGCPGPCDIGVETAPIGSTSWTPRDLGAAPDGEVVGVQLARSGPDVYLLATGHTSGGADSAQSTLYRSSDDGSSWTRSSDPCASGNGTEVDSTTVASGPGGSVALVCRVRGTESASMTVSDDGGAHFTSRGALPQSGGLLADGGDGHYLLALDTLSRSTDDGGHWTRQVPGIEARFVWVGFESTSTARVIAEGGSIIWTTHDAGLRWTYTRFD